MTTFDNIKKYSSLRKLSLREVARKAGLSENALYRYNQGIEPKFETLKAVAKVLNVSVSDLSQQYDQEKADNHKKTDVDLAKDDEDIILSFDGKPIPDEDKELIRRLLRGK